MTKRPMGGRKPDQSTSLTEDSDSSAFNDDTANEGLTLKQAAFIYFGGMALFIAGMVVAGLAT